MLQTLKEILHNNWQWRGQIANLSVFELIKKSRGAVLSWVWFFIKPAMYIFCFWFAIAVGLRAAQTQSDGIPYVLWLSAGIIPWFYMSDMLGAGIDVFNRYKYLVNKVKFPLSGISTIYSSAMMLIELMLIVALFVMYFAFGLPPTIYLLQVPVLLFLMWVFWTFVSILFSPLSALSKDIANLVHALSSPIFWLSGILFNVDKITIGWVKVILNLNPVTFFASSFRNAFEGKCWFWENINAFGGFLLVFLIIVIFALLSYGGLKKEVADVL